MNIHPTFAPFLASIAPPQSVHRTPALPSFNTTIGENLSVQVFYEHTPAEAAIYDVNSPVCGPGHDAEVEIIKVMLDGQDLRDVLADSVIESLEDQALARVAA